MATYTDFGQNMGRYSVGNTNALLDYLNKDGVKITYTGGQAAYTLQHGMIDFSSQRDSGEGAALGYNFYATVRHNGVHDNTFTGNYIGGTNAIRYQSIEYRESENNAFLLTPSSVDYKISRQNKLITDVTGTTMYSGDLASLSGELMYRAASGMMYKYDHEGNQSGVGWQFIVGGIMSITGPDMKNEQDGAFSIYNYMDPSSEGINETAPLPYASMPGDSGSPSWVWNNQTGRYEFIAGDQSGDGVYFSQYQGATTWTTQTMNSFNKEVAVGADHIVYINGTTQTDTLISDSTNGVSTTLWQGTITDGAGNELANFIGVKDGVNTWNDLSVIKDQANWYNYNNSVNINDVTYTLFNATASGAGAELSYADLFKTENLVFKAASTSIQNIVIADKVDLGIGYAHFTRGEQASADYLLTSVDGAQLNSAGYIVDAGVDLHIQVTNSTANIMREWRKVGEGNMYLEGAGNNNILLNVGGAGKTYLNQQGGYAAYNVLANNGTTVVIGDINQIARDFTFGFRGGVLDMNGQSMTWNNANTDVNADGFTIHALDEGAIITNTAAETVTLTWTQSGAQTWLGSFKDTEQGALKFIYNGGAGSSLMMHGIYTDLRHHADSGIEVQSGTVTLAGTHTLHAVGSAYGWWDRYSNADDWHYADMAANVTVAGGATFELGSHARLTGNVTVAEGGTFIMREGVKHEFEYIEGAYTPESTYAIADFYGLKGDVNLAQNAVMKLIYADGTTANNTYAGNISGDGNFYAQLGTAGATLTLTGTNTFSGTKELVTGGLIVDGVKGLGDVSGGNLWKIDAQAWLAVHNASDAQNVLTYIDGSSAGVLALTSDVKEALDMSGHGQLIIGAAQGHSVHYGTQDQTLSADGGAWVLGGGGGELVVDFKLSGSNGLILGNEYGHGVVYLNNNNNDFTGTVSFAGGVTLLYSSLGALGDNSIKNIDLDYSNRIQAMQGISAHVIADSQGVLLVDNTADINLNLTTHRNLHVGAAGDVVFTGAISVAEGQAYRFGGMSGTLTLNTQLDAGHDLIVDGQTYTGGKLLLGSVQNNLDGALTLMGYNSDFTNNHYGDVTLSFAAGVNNTLMGLSATTLKDGGMMDLAGTTQTFTDMQTQSGSAVFDSMGGGTLKMIANQDLTLAGNMSVQNIMLSGAGVVTLVGSHEYELFTADGVELKLGAGSDSNVLSANGTFCLTNGAALSLNGYGTKGNLLLKDGGTLNAMSNGIDGHIAVEGAGNYITGTDGSRAWISGEIYMSDGAELSFTGDTAFISGAEHLGSTGGTIYFQGSKWELSRGGDNGTQSVGGTLVFNKGGETNLHSSGGANNLTRNFEHIRIDAGNTLKVTEQDWNTIWNIHQLSGEGNLVWNATATHWYASRMVLDGENTFSGTITLDRDHDDANRAYSAYIELAHDKAAQNAVVALDGSSAGGVASLAINTANAHVQGIVGNEHSYLYAGPSFTGGGDGSAALSAPQESDRRATLTIQGSGAYEFAGNVGGGEDGNGLRLVMNGSGTQTFSGERIQLTGVEVLSGTLALNSAGLTVGQDITIAQGGTLKLTDGELAGSLTLNTGNELKVASSNSGETAVFEGNLTLNGGQLSFSADALSTTAAVLNLNGELSMATTGQTMNFFNTSSLTTGTYLLASGDWSALREASFTTTGLNYFTTLYSADESGLSLTLSLKEGSSVWDGTDANNSWTDTAFGNQAAVTDMAVFNDSAANKEVRITAGGEVNAMLFDSAHHYTLSGVEDAVVTAQTLTHQGTGITTLNSGVQVLGATVIEAGELVIHSADTLKGEINGAGTLTVNMNGGTLNIGSLQHLNIAGGSYDAETAVTATHITVADGAQLNIGAGVAQGNNMVIAGDKALSMGANSGLTGSVSLTGDAVIMGGTNDFEITGSLNTGEHTLTKTGAGAMNVNSSALNGNINVQEGSLVLHGGWKNYNQLGTVTLNGGTMLKLEYGVGMEVDSLVMKDGSRFEFINGNGSDGNSQMTADIALEGTVTVKGSLYGGSSHLSGTVSGAGTLKLENGNYWTLASTLKDGAEGALSISSGANVTINRHNFYTGGTTIEGGEIITANLFALGAGDVALNGGTLKLDQDLAIHALTSAQTSGTLNLNGKNLNIVNSTAAGHFAGEVTGNGVIYKSGAETQTLTGKVSLGGAVISNGALALNGASTITGSVLVGGGALVTDKVQISAKNAQVKDASITGATITLNAVEGESTVAATEAGTTALIAGAHIAQAEGQTLKLESVVMDYNSQISGGVIYADNLIVQIQSGMNAETLTERSFSAGMSLSGVGDVADLVLDRDIKVVDMLCSALVNAELSGSTLTLDFSDLGAQTAPNGLLALSFGDINEAMPIDGDTAAGIASTILQLDGMNIIAINGAEVLNVYTTSADGNTTLYIGNLSVPEPSSAALSLLGLAAMVMRRRRK